MEVRREDIFTVPNAVSVAGFALVVDGARNIDEPLGLAEVAVGRVLDLADGKIARATGQTSEFGAAVDGTLDKLGCATIIAAEWQKGVAPKSALAAICAQNLANSIATGVAMRNHPKEALQPSNAGKYAMFTQNAALGAYALSHATKEAHPKTSNAFRLLGHLATVVGVGVLGAKATYDYIKRAK